ncbi:MAG: radical SAM family heme chaperone HemW [Bacteroidales bacterium]
MKGLYLHIPFCRQACRYCDFYFTVSLHQMDPLTQSLIKELHLRENESGHGPLHTLYLGGGTPSLLSPEQLEKIMNTLHQKFSFRDHPEITMECNPDDLNRPYLDALLKLGFNRLSIGIQSFHDRELKLMRRSHTADQAMRSVQEAADAGFSNITIDLIYGIPGQDLNTWEETLYKALSLPVTHLSAYHLTFEPGTVFDHWRKKGKLIPVTEGISQEQYVLLRQRTRESGYEHYEISNFAREGKRSKHNMLYWSGDHYMGVGPSAHSFDGRTRRWNAASVKKYMEAIHSGEPFWEEERLTAEDKYHDYLITTLRTSRGAEPKTIEKEIGEAYAEHFRKKTKPFLESGALVFHDQRLVIPADHWLITDHILRELFL